MYFFELSTETRDFLTSGQDLADFSHETAERCQVAIYYAEAHKFLAEDASHTERWQAEEEARDVDMQTVSYDTLACGLAYFIVRARIIALVTDELKQYEGEAPTDEVRAIMAP